jgi:hypothetical protein
MLHKIFSFLKAFAASIPSHVLAIFIKILSLFTPSSSYRAMILYILDNKLVTFALSIVAYLSKLNLASTSVETYPLNI